MKQRKMTVLGVKTLSSLNGLPFDDFIDKAEFGNSIVIMVCSNVDKWISNLVKQFMGSTYINGLLKWGVCAIIKSYFLLQS